MGDVIALSFATPSHLSRLGILPGYQPSKQMDLNFLMKTALDKVNELRRNETIETELWL